MLQIYVMDLEYENDNQIILDKLYKLIKSADLLNSSLRETAIIVEDQLDSDGDEIIDDLSRAKDCIIKFYRCISLAIDRMNTL